MTQVTPDELVRTRSYFIWETEGRPDGRHLEHWLQAAKELEAEIAAPPSVKRKSEAKVRQRASS